ncbi:MAG: lipoyl(octanoyl) transferase LipB [Nostoc sp. EfeVER01]|uniref:lipoyl(octanoyl) transferase LipB n=1 Tax=unclassified Nostoc TaxID=2593658 RepID=UPI002AD2D159|nr:MULTISPECIES: lipoyl(octanoyl) transferase LipB [unclassified Nostoc]MDZ7947685.1 lipoyl(octanoyl) transferase LipB [Nostoc sp. EfeVER01]MDZ7994810.1 lipoyl(octanoyl) transferase LipB [Nostoc sp. EspVER01]
MIHSNEPQKNICLLYNQGLMPYLEAHGWQRSLLTERIHDPSLDDILILLEHPPVYTLGQGSNLDFLKFDIDPLATLGDATRSLLPRRVNSQYDVHRVERGGEVTYHCPGQLVGYPILNLQRYRKDLHWYLRQLEEVIIRVLAVYGLQGERIPAFTGVWLQGRKVAAIGIKVSRWITMHGFALNVCPDMTGFERIVPCGISDKPVGSLAEWIPGITCQEVRFYIAESFAEVFGVELVESQPQGFFRSE